jgi:hypothetical protein
MFKKIKSFFTLLLLLLGVTACNKKEYSIKVDGHIYNNCNLVPVENVEIRLYNSAQDGFAQKIAKTDSNGYFNVELKGEGNTDLKISIEDVHSGPINSCSMNVIKSDTSYLELFKLNLNDRDTLYASVIPVDFFNSMFFVPPVYKIPFSEFKSNKALLKIDRRKLLNYSFNTNLALNKLWVNNNFDAHIVWGVGNDDFQSNKEKLIQRTFGSNDRIKLLYLKSCDGLNEIILY